MTLLRFVLRRIEKRLVLGTYSRKGRNFSGRLCVFNRGGGLIRKYRLIDFKRRLNLFGYVYKIFYDPNRTAYLGLISYDNGFFSYIILTEGVRIGSRIFSGNLLINNSCLSIGSSLDMFNIGLFSIISNIESSFMQGATLCRAAGSGALLISKMDNCVTLKLKSGWLINIDVKCIASIGYSSNMLHNMHIIGKAGKNRGLGKRPVVRGVAMNPCDHPHGGGNGKTSP